MKQYIEKSVITEEIKRLIKSPILYKSEDVETRINILEYLLSFLDTLEVKEVDLEKEIDKELETRWRGEYLFVSKFRESVKHFFELGMQQSKNDNNNEE